MLRNKNREQRSRPNSTDNGQEQHQAVQPKSFYDAAQEVLLNADLETIFDFDSFCMAVFNIAQAPFQQRPSVFMQLQVQRSRFFEETRFVYMNQSTCQGHQGLQRSPPQLSSQCQQDSQLNCSPSSNGLSSSEDQLTVRINGQLHHEVSSTISTVPQSSNSCQTQVISLPMQVYQPSSLIRAFNNTSHQAQAMILTKQEPTLHQSPLISASSGNLKLKLSPTSFDPIPSQRVLQSQRKDNEEISAAQPIILPAIFETFSPNVCKQEAFQQEEEHKHSSSPSSSSSLSLSSMEDQKNPFNITHIYKMARRHQMDTIALVHELKPGSTRRESKMLEKKSPKMKTNDHCLTYGEITMGGVNKMIRLVNHGLFKDSRYVGPELFDSSVYKLSKESKFLDIGHATGKVVMHIALAVGCKSKGIEVNQVRYDLSQRLKNLLIESYNTQGWEELVELQMKNATDFKKYLVGRENATHIYMYDKLFSDELLVQIVERLNNTRFKVLISSKTPRQLGRLGLQRCLCAGQFKGSITGSVFEMYVYVKQYQYSPHSSKPNSPQIQQVKVEGNVSESKTITTPQAICKSEPKQSSLQPNCQESTAVIPSSVKIEVKQRAVKEEIKQTPIKIATDSVIGKRGTETPKFGKHCISQANSHYWQEYTNPGYSQHRHVIDRIQEAISEYTQLKSKTIDDLYESLKPTSSSDRGQNDHLSLFKQNVDDCVTGVRACYYSEYSQKYLSIGKSSQFKGKYVSIKLLSENAFEKLISRQKRFQQLKSKVPGDESHYLLPLERHSFINHEKRLAAYLKTLPLGDLQELIEGTRIHVPAQLLQHQFKKIALMLEKMHTAGFCHWGIYLDKVLLKRNLNPCFNINDSMHQLTQYMPGGPRCRYQLPPLYTADMKVEQISPKIKKAIDLYMFGVLIYRALLGVSFPYASQGINKSTPFYSFKQLDINFPKERLELMGWNLEEVNGAKSLLEGLLHLDPEQQMKIQDVVAHSWLTIDNELLKQLKSA